MQIEREKQDKVIGVILTHNCSRMIEELIQRIPMDVLHEVIISDNRSGLVDQEKTGSIAAKYNIPFFPHENFGYGGNVKYGLQKALERGAEFAVEIHGDGQFDPSVIPAALEKIRSGADFVMASRFTNWRQPREDGMSLIRFIANILLSTCARIVLRIPWTEYHSGFRIYSKKLIEVVGNKGSNDYIFDFQIIAIARYHNMNFDEIPIRANYKKEHSSISLPAAAVYFFRTLIVLIQYLLAQIGIKNDLFK